MLDLQMNIIVFFMYDQHRNNIIGRVFHKKSIYRFFLAKATLLWHTNC